MNASDTTPNRDKRSDAGYQRAVGDFVHREVIYCVSSLVYEIGTKNIDEWHHLFRQEDWETPALEAIRAFSPEHLRELLSEDDVPLNADDEPEALAKTFLQHLKRQDALRDFCDANQVDPEQNEVYEHWIVSEWLAARLEERGEVIERDFFGLTIWGRACTGQAILLDSVICSIYDEVAS